MSKPQISNLKSQKSHSSFVICHLSFVIRHLPFPLLLVAYLVLAVGYSLADPLYESTDELRHFRYVRHLVAYRSLPVQRPDAPRAQSHHPPLYYGLGALASGWVPIAQEVYYEPTENPFWAYRYWEVSDDNKNQYLHGDDELFREGPFHDVALAVYLVRWMTVLIGAGVVWLTYRIGREIFKVDGAGWPALALGGTALVAFNPQFLYLSGAVNNDVPAALCGAAVLLVCVRLVRKGPSLRTDVTLGILFGLALLTKFNLLALLALITLAYLLAVRPTHDWRAFLRGAVVVAGQATLISGWWFLRNWRLYGDPTGLNQLNELWAGRPATGNWWVIRQSLPYLWSSLWGRFGYGQVPLPQPIYQGLLIFCLVSLIGYLLPRRRSLSPAILLLLGMTVLTFTAVVFYYMLIQPAGAMGRFFFPGLPAFALLLFLGLSRFFPRRLTWAVSLAVIVGMVALATYGLVGVLAPAFTRPRPLTESEIGSVPNPTDVRWTVDGGSVAQLLGYQVTPAVVEPGGMVEVTLYWQALTRTDQDYAVFVHLLSEVGTMVAQRDTYPGLGRYPTTAWEPGVAFADTYRVHVPETAYAPDVGYVQIGIYLPDGPRLTTPEGDDALSLAMVEIRRQPTPLLPPLEGEGRGGPNPLNVNFGNQAALVGYTLDQRVVRPGDPIRLTLHWRALAPMETDYCVFAHVLGVEDQVWASSDSQPAGGAAPTSQWQADQTVEDTHELVVGLTTPPGFYDVEVGIYPLGGERLPVVAEDGRWLGNRVLLSKIRVVSDE